MHTHVIILAGGKGKRMGGDVPKAIIPFRNKPLARHLIESVIASGVDARPVVVVGHRADEVKAALGDDVEYVLQQEQLGTGHAVSCAAEILRGKADRVIVLYGDHPFVRPETVRALAEIPLNPSPTIFMATVVVPDYEIWRAPLYDFGRIVRDTNGNILCVVEKKDASEAERNGTEVNPGFYNFDASWLWETLPRLKNINASGEYYLTDTIGLAMEGGLAVESFQIEASECLGINTPEHFALASELQN